ncbi:MAG: GH1 family beta-glucosidase [Phycisphaerae bacterium]|nr:GH1 family beta-glucosidase [Phycisphaerae bacterium]
MAFKKDFTWGVASASFQIEGAAFEDGKGPSVWDMLCRKPGASWRGQVGDVACDHYRRYREDIAIMKRLGVRASRFSVSWPRVLPAGVGAVNDKGLDFYDRLVDEYLAAGIEPWLTLFHWDYPLALYHRGGWLNRESADWFGEYARVLAERLGDRVSHWMTLNEPQCFLIIGHEEGRHAPGDQLRFDEVVRAIHHTLLAHGRGVQALRAHAKTKPTVGVAMVASTRMPQTETPADIDAARSAMFAYNPSIFQHNAWWFDPMFKGEYPAEGLARFGPAAPDIQPGDMETIAQPLDFLGVNIYNGQFIEASPEGPRYVDLPPGYPKSAYDNWPITPTCLYWGPRFLHERYGLPIVITENGGCVVDTISLDGCVHDPQRTDYLHRHLLELRRAADDGVPVDGYFYWSFADNFEWNLGDSIRMGLIFTDYPTQRRIPKDSAAWYSEVIRTNGNNL